MKHKAVINIQIEIHDVLDSGECSGRPLSQKEMEQYGLKSKMLRTITGLNKEECIGKVQAMLGKCDG